MSAELPKPPETTRDTECALTDFRRANKDQLSLALMDSRNHTLQLLRPFEAAGGSVLQAAAGLLGQCGWFQEWWIGRNTEWRAGSKAQSDATRLASIDPQADQKWAINNGQARAIGNSPGKSADGLQPHPDAPDTAALRAYLLETLESTLELLEKAEHHDDDLYFFRLALFHEDRVAERLLMLAQSNGLALKLQLPGPLRQREPLLIPATRWLNGVASNAGFAFDNEQPAFEEPVPEFEIDAHPVTWAQYVEFVDDGGYDNSAFWHPLGWQWLAQLALEETRRAPRYVDQIGVGSGAVMQTRFGQARRMLGGQVATHVTWFEADAWARWAGRRLPAEVEWEVAAHMAQRRGFQWGDVWEWTASGFRPFDGFKPGPWAAYSQRAFGTHRVLKGASFATRARMQSPRFRNFALPTQDDVFCGFRSCAI